MPWNRSNSICIALLFLSSLTSFAADEWPPIAPEDLKMTSFDKVPGASAFVLSREVTSDDLSGLETHYVRIKILREEGKKYANVETEVFLDQIAKIENIQGRSIRPDGTITAFNGKAFDKLVAKYKQFSYSAKSFTLPDVQVGSIIEYRYTKRWERMYLFGADWNIDQPLFTRQAKFAFRRGGGYAQLSITNYFARNEFEQPKMNPDGWIRLEVQNVDPFDREEYMPPEQELRWRVYIYYPDRILAQSIDAFWNQAAKNWSTWAEKYMDKSSEAQKVVVRLTSSGDTPTAKLQKLYNYVQNLKNLSYTRQNFDKSDIKYKDNENIADVLRNGYGYPAELTRTFVALARAAGFDTTLVRAAERDRSYLHKEIREFSRQLVAELALVKFEGKEIYLDPGTPHCPFGMLSWEDTDTEGVRLDKVGAVWVKTPALDAASSSRRRTARLSMDEEGTLTGELLIRLEGQEALWRRIEHRHDDAQKRDKELTEEIKNWLAPGAEVQLKNVSDWDGSGPVEITTTVRFPAFATHAGKRLLLPANIFTGSDGQPFTTSKRKHPIYFSYPYRRLDEITVSLPAGWKAETVPDERERKENFGSFHSTVALDGSTVRVQRELTLLKNSFEERYYPLIRILFANVHAGTDEQVVLTHAQ